MCFRDKLQNVLRNVDGLIDIGSLAKKLDICVDPMLENIILITNEFKQIYKDNAAKMIKGSADLMDSFFKTQIVDLGFLCQHKIKEINITLVDKHDTMGHRMFYDSWMLHRGY